MSVITLQINGEALQLTKDSYTEKLGSVEELLMTEAGTRIRSIVRTGIYGLSVSYTGTEQDKILLDAAVQMDSLTVTVWDETTGENVEKQMFLDPASYSAALIVEDSKHRYYKFGFTLEDLEAG